MKRSENKRLSRYVLLMGAISILAVAGSMVTMQSIHATETKEGKVNLATNTKIQSSKIPPIDESAPSLIETATFGLG